MSVSVQRTNQNVIITLPLDVDPIDLQQALSYFKFVDIVGRSKASQKDIDDLSKSVKSNMASDLLSRLKQLDEFKDL